MSSSTTKWILVKSFVRSIEGLGIAVEMQTGDTIATLKAKLWVEEGIAPSLQKLMYMGQEVQDDANIVKFSLDSGIVKFSPDSGCIHLSVRSFSQPISPFAIAAGLDQSQEPGHLRGHFFHPTTIKHGVNRKSAARPVHRYPLRYVGVDDRRREYSLSKHLPLEASGYEAVDSHLGLVVLQRPAGKGQPVFTVWDPASGLYACVPPPPAEAFRKDAVFVINDNSFDDVPENLGGVVLSRKEGEDLAFQLAFVSVESKEKTWVVPRAWVATVDGQKCSWEGPLFANTLYMKGPVFMERHCVRAHGKLYWHLYGDGIASKSVICLDPVLRRFRVVTVPRPANRLGEGWDGMLLAASIGQGELLYLNKKVGTKWSPMLPPHLLEHALDGVPVLDSRSRRVTRLTGFDPAYPGTVLVKTSGNGKFRYDIEQGKLERLITLDGLEWGDPIYPYFL